jgi:hypothetical protein
MADRDEPADEPQGIDPAEQAATEDGYPNVRAWLPQQTRRTAA